MARKRNVDAFGKSWSPIDIQNLEKAVKLYERLNVLNQNFANSLSGANNIWKQINEKTEIQEELQKLGVKHSQEECKYIIQLSREQEKYNQALDKAKNTKTTISKTDLAFNTVKTGSSTAGHSFTLSNAGSFYQAMRLQPQAAEALKWAAQSAGGHRLKKGTPEFTNYVNAAAAQRMSESANKYSTSASLIQVAANTFSKAVSVFSQLFMAGMGNQYRSFNDNFTNISVRTGMTRGTYFSEQTRINNTLSSRGLFNNVSNSEVTNMWNKLANTGMNQADMIANAIDNVVTNKIVPYLDTSSQQFNILNNRLDGNFVKQIRGINLYNQQIAGNNYTTERLLQQIIDEVQPMSDEALQNLTQGSAEMTALINKLTPVMGADAAMQYATQLFKTQKYSDQMMRSGTINEKLGIISSLQKGINIYDPTHYNDFIGAVLDNQLTLMGGAPGYGSTMAGLQTNIMGSAFGIDYGQRMGIKNVQSKGLTGAQLVALTDGSLSGYTNTALANFASDQNQTAKNMQEIYMENMSTYVAAIYEQIGYWGDVIGVLLKGIGGILGAKIAGSIGKKLLSSGGKHAATSGLAGGLKNLGGGLATSATGSVASGLAVAGGAAAGIGMAGYGGYQAYQDFKSGDIVGGSIATVGAAGGAVGAGALIALGASNPVGWVALAIGGAALVGHHLYKLATETGDITDELEKQSNEVIRSYQEQNNQTIDNLNILKDQLKGTDDLEKQKQLLINAGIASEQELQKEQYNSKEALIALTDQYIASTLKLNGKGEELLAELEGKQNSKQNDIATGIYGMMDKGYGAMSETEKAAAAKFGNQYFSYISTLAANGDEDAKWRLEQWNKMGVNLSDGIFSEADWKAIMTKGGNATNNRLIKQFFSDKNNSEGVYKLTVDGNVQNVLGLEKGFQKTDYTQAINYLNAALMAQSKDSALSLLANAKSAGLTYDMIGTYYQSELLNKWGIESYRKGLNKVPYDNYLANLHEGEAVLTASTAGELRNLITTYRETSNQGFIVDAAIANQTTILVAKLDEVVKAVQAINGNTVTGGWSSSVKNSLRTMSNTKVFG